MTSYHSHIEVNAVVHTSSKCRWVIIRRLVIRTRCLVQNENYISFYFELGIHKLSPQVKSSQYHNKQWLKAENNGDNHLESITSPSSSGFGDFNRTFLCRKFTRVRCLYPHIVRKTYTGWFRFQVWLTCFKFQMTVVWTTWTFWEGRAGGTGLVRGWWTGM